MHAVQVTRFGPPEVLTYAPLPERLPGPGQALVRVAASGINFADIMARMGLYPDAGRPPFVPGMEFSGTIESIGEGVQGLKVGGRVAGVCPAGGYAERVVSRADLLFELPESIDLVSAAALPVVYLTAWHALVYLGNLHRGERILIHNAGGGLGMAALQIARLRGAEILATASSGKHDWLREQGADHLFDYRQRGWSEQLREAIGGEGVDMILDPRAGAALAESFELLAHTGRLVVCGVSGMAPSKRRRPLRALWTLLRTPRFSPLRMMVKNRGVFGVHLGHLWHRTELLRPQMAEILRRAAAGELAPVVDRTFPLEQAADAHHYIQDRRNRGKVVLTTE